MSHRISTALCTAALAVCPAILAACGGADTTGAGTSDLTVQIGEASPERLLSAPSVHMTEEAVAIRVVDGETTVFVSGPRTLLAVSGTVSIGTTANNLVVWATGADQESPLSATMGTAYVDRVSLQPGGDIALRIVDALKPADSFQPSVHISGSLAGVVSQ